MKVPKAVQEPSGMWYIRLRIKNEAGDMMTYAIRESTEKKAVDVALAVKASLKADMMESKTRTGDKTLRKAVDEYINRRSNVLSPSTIRGYRIIQRNRFQRVMDKRMGEVKDWQTVINAEAAECSAKTLKNAWLFVKSVLRDNGITPTVALPAVVKPDKKWLTPEQCLIFVGAVHGRRCEIGALLALHGLRRSEIYGLTWDRIDLKTGTIRVYGALVPDEGHQFVMKSSNKTQSSKRVVKILIPALQSALEAVEDKTGMVMHDVPNTLYVQINAVCRENGLPEVGVHGLRHSFASLCYHLGISEMETMKRGGWSNVSTVHEIYTHISAADELEADEKLSQFFENGK